MQDLSGQILKSYEVVELIGAGGFGAVYRAFQPVLEREVAIKVILPEYANRPEFIHRFETEAQLVARLEHPHIVPLYDYWREPDSAYLVMRYLRGGNLRELLRDEGTMSLSQAMQMLNQIASALAFAHRHGVIHRDIKSDNIFFDEDKNFYLGDFGIAKNTATFDDPVLLNVIGTPAYLSPEQIRGEVLTTRSDIYSLGIVVYEILTGVKPFFDFSPATILYKQLHVPLPKIQDLRPDLPEALDEILGKATAKADNKRYATALEFAKDFTKIAQAQNLDVLDTQERQRVIAIHATAEISETIPLTNPFKGLRAFQQADTKEFFGREALIKRLIEHFDEDKIEEAFLAVVGASGSGKSSVVKAGLLPAIRKGAFGNQRSVFIAEMLPSNHPFEELEAALLSISSQPLPHLLQQLRADGHGFVDAVKTILPHSDQLMVLLIDQFEELFTLVHFEERQQFINAILVALQDKTSRIKIIITLRADFYDRPLFYPEFGELVRKSTEVVVPLTPPEITDVILQPLERMGFAAEPALVSTIVHDVTQQAGALPLLQYALTELFERHAGKILRLSMYEEIGGISGAVAKRAEEIYQNFDAVHQEITRQMFLRLVVLGENTVDTRHRVSQIELLSLVDVPARMREVIDRYGRYRLLTFDSDVITRSATVELAHEAIIHYWGRLQNWLEESREALRLQQRLTQATEEWLAGKRDTSFLMLGVRLQQVEDMVNSGNLPLTFTEKMFLSASIQQRNAERAENAKLAELEKQRQREELQNQINKRRQYRFFAVSMSFLAAIFCVLAIYALVLRQVATESLQIAQERAAESQSLMLANNARNALNSNNNELGLALALQAADIFSPPLPDVLRTLGSAVYAPGARWYSQLALGTILSADISDNGTYSGVSGGDGSIRVWVNQTGGTVFTFQSDNWVANDILFLGDGNRLLIASSDGFIRELDILTGRELRAWQAHAENVTVLAVSPDETTVASSGADGVMLWDLQTGQKLRIISDKFTSVLSLVYSPDGKMLAAGTGDHLVSNASLLLQQRVIVIWDVQSGRLVQTIKPDSGVIRNLVFSPNNRYIATGLWDNTNLGTIRIYNIITGAEYQRLYGHSSSISNIAFSPSGLTLYSAGWDKTIFVFDITRGIEIASYVGFEQPILMLNLSHDGRYLLLGQGNLPAQRPINENTVKITYWDTLTGDLVKNLTSYDNWLWSVDVSPDGRLIASGSGLFGRDIDLSKNQNTSFYIWDAETGEELQRITDDFIAVSDVLFTNDSQRLFSASWDGRVVQWDLATYQPITQYTVEGIIVHSIDLSPDETTLLAGYGDGNIRLWDVATGRLLQTIGVDRERVNHVAYSPDGQTYITAGEDSTLRLWDATTHEAIGLFEGHTDGVSHVIFSADGTRIASSSWDDSVRLWNVATGELIRNFDGHTGNTLGLALTTDGQFLLSSSADRTIRLWDVATGQEIHRYVGHGNWVMDIDLFPDEQQFISASQDKLLKVWHIAPNVQELTAYAEDIRQERALTCEEREFYDIDLCTPVP